MNDTGRDTRGLSARIRAQLAPAVRALIDQLPDDPDTASADELAAAIELGEQARRTQRASLPTDPHEAMTADPDHVMTWLALGVEHLRTLHREHTTTHTITPPR